MKSILTFLLVSLMTVTCYGTSLVWDYPGVEQADMTNGYIIYFEGGGEQYNKTLTWGDLIIDGETIMYKDIDHNLNLHPNVKYTFWATAYNEHTESGPSATITYERDGFIPPTDHLPGALSGPSDINYLGVVE